MKILIVIFSAFAVLQFGEPLVYAQRGNAGGSGNGQGRGPAVQQGGGGASPRQGPSRRAGRVSGEPAGVHKGSAGRTNPKVLNSIERNPRLAARLQEMLPPGMSLTDAASGFKNRGQFIATLHVSNNLSIPFEDMKAKRTGPESTSLGKAIQELRPAMTEQQSKTEAKKAEKQAKETEKVKSTS